MANSLSHAALGSIRNSHTLLNRRILRQAEKPAKARRALRRSAHRAQPRPAQAPACPRHLGCQAATEETRLILVRQASKCCFTYLLLIRLFSPPTIFGRTCYKLRKKNFSATDAVPHLRNEENVSIMTRQMHSGVRSVSSFGGGRIVWDQFSSDLSAITVTSACESVGHVFETCYEALPEPNQARCKDSQCQRRRLSASPRQICMGPVWPRHSVLSRMIVQHGCEKSSPEVSKEVHEP